MELLYEYGGIYFDEKILFINDLNIIDYDINKIYCTSNFNLILSSKNNPNTYSLFQLFLKNNINNNDIINDFNAKTHPYPEYIIHFLKDNKLHQRRGKVSTYRSHSIKENDIHSFNYENLKEFLYKGINYLIEIKSKKTSKLTVGEHKFQNAWTGQVATCYSYAEILFLIRYQF